MKTLLTMLLLFKGPQGVSTLHITIVQSVKVFSFGLLLHTKVFFLGLHTITGLNFTFNFLFTV